MNLQNTISTELLALAPFLATVKKDGAFGLPPGYFVQLEQDTLSKVLEAAELNAEAPVTMQLLGKQVMCVPQGYFEELYYNVTATTITVDNPLNLHPDTLKAQALTALTTPPNYFDQLHNATLQKITNLAQDEDSATNHINPIAENEGFATPADFFANMQANIWDRINNLADEEAPLDTATIDQAAANEGFTTPDGYFDHNAEAILYAVADEEYQSPILQSLKNKTGFEAPQGYFEQLQQNVLNQVAQQQPQTAKEVTMPAQPRQSNPALRYVMRAAAIVAVLFVGWQLLNRSGGNTGNNELAMLNPNPKLTVIMETAMKESGITQQDLQLYISNNAEEFANFDLEELNITAKDLSMNNTSAKNIELTPEAMDMLDISADDIDQFLSE